MLCDGVQKPQKLKMSVITLRAVEPLCPPHSQVWSMAIPGSIWCVQRATTAIRTRVLQVNQPDAASLMIFTIVCSTSCATPSSCGELNIASRVVGFKVARMVWPPSW